MTKSRLVVVGCVIGVLATASSPSSACSLDGPHEHELDPAAQATDQIAPVLSSLTVSEIRRGRSGPGVRCGGSATIALSVAATDDGVSQDQIGFRLSLAGGQLPPGLELPTTALRASFGRLPLTWTETPPSEGAPISFSLQVVAVDLAGNESAPQTVVVEDDGSVGCRVAGDTRPTASTLVVVLTALVFAGRRRRSLGSVRG